MTSWSKGILKHVCIVIGALIAWFAAAKVVVGQMYRIGMVQGCSMYSNSKICNPSYLSAWPHNAVTWIISLAFGAVIAAAVAAVFAGICHLIRWMLVGSSKPADPWEYRAGPPYHRLGHEGQEVAGIPRTSEAVADSGIAASFGDT